MLSTFMSNFAHFTHLLPLCRGPTQSIRSQLHGLGQVCENCNSIAINIACFQPIGGTSHCILLWSQSGAAVWLVANQHSCRWTLWFALRADKYVLTHH